MKFAPKYWLKFCMRIKKFYPLFCFYLNIIAMLAKELYLDLVSDNHHQILCSKSHLFFESTSLHLRALLALQHKRQRQSGNELKKLCKNVGFCDFSFEPTPVAIILVIFPKSPRWLRAAGTQLMLANWQLLGTKLVFLHRPL